MLRDRVPGEVWAQSRPHFASSFPRRGRAFRVIARVLVWAFLAQILPATAFADLSVPLRIPIAEWRKVIRKEMAVEYLCKKAIEPGVQIPAPRRAGPWRGARPMLVSLTQAGTTLRRYCYRGRLSRARDRFLEALE